MGINCVSLFDGICAAGLALKRNNQHVENLFTSEIDPHAISVTRRNFPNNIELGDVTKIKSDKLPKIDLLIGGSPCQGFSRAGQELAFDDPRSKLFFEYVRILNETSPTYFLLENVRMSQENEDVISDALGVKPLRIDSSLLSGQMRKRNYWTNIPGIHQPKDKGIMLRDVVDKDALVDADKAHAVIASIGRTTHREYFMKNQGQIVYDAIALSNIYGGFKEKKPRVHVQKSPAIRTAAGGGHIPSLVLNIEGMEKEFNLETYRKFIRKINPNECARLQTFPDDWARYMEDGREIPATHQYRLYGNSYTVDVISHILKGMDKGSWF